MRVAQRPWVILLAIVPSIAIGLVNGLYADELARLSAARYWTFDALQFVAIPAAGAALLYWLGGYRPADYGFRGPGGGNDFATLALFAFVTFVYWAAYEPVKAFAFQLFWFTAADPVFTSVLPMTPGLRVLALLYVCLSAALIEEPVYRSLPWLYFSSTLSAPVVPYVLSTTLLFSAIHWEYGLPNLFATASLGVAAALLYTRIRNVWPFIGAHFLVGVWTYRW